MEKEQIREYREYAWKYFEAHAEHRLRTFSFYIIFATLLIGAFATLIGNNGLQKSQFLFPFSLVFLSFIFWKFEERTRMLVKNAEEALKYLDEISLDDKDSVLALFNNDDLRTRSLPKWPLTIGHFSYSRVFRWVYVFFSVLGCIGISVCLFTT
ncbi:MAG: hypothetical protein GKR93_12565 [Gammaproteobacteria bacterium]|nr:hypothetical protein [Gammaproteobacteria bacterium]